PAARADRPPRLGSHVHEGAGQRPLEPLADLGGDRAHDAGRGRHDRDDAGAEGRLTGPDMPRSGVDIVPAKLREARTEAGLSLTERAQGLVSRAHINLLERGRTRPSPAVLQGIARRTGRPVEYFLAKGAQIASPTPLAEDADLTADLARITRRLRSFMRKRP